MLVIVVAHIGHRAFEARVRDGTGPGSKRVPGIPVLIAETREAVIGRALAAIKPEQFAEYGNGYRVDDREVTDE